MTVTLASKQLLFVFANLSAFLFRNKNILFCFLIEYCSYAQKYNSYSTERCVAVEDTAEET
jgi:hypothetical protein